MRFFHFFYDCKKLRKDQLFKIIDTLSNFINSNVSALVYQCNHVSNCVVEFVLPVAQIKKAAPYISEKCISMFRYTCFFTACRILIRNTVFGFDFERRGRSNLDNNTPYVDGSVTNYGASKRDATLGVSPGRLPSRPLNFLDLFARPSTTSMAHATTAKINILEINYERDSAAPRAPSYTSEDNKFQQCSSRKRKI